MKKRFLLFLALSGLIMTSCNLEKCACNTFGANEVVKEKHAVTVSAEKAAPRQ